MRNLLLAVVLSPLLLACGGPELQLWHQVDLKEEFSSDSVEDIDTFADYQALEVRLFEELDRKIYDPTDTGPEQQLNRYSAGSAADPRGRRPDWNRSFELIPERPRGGVLLLHGMSDSPYSLRALGEALYNRGYRVLGLRLPGHGTIPAGLKAVQWQEMAASVKLAMTHLAERLAGQPLHIIGYSTGAPLALNFALDTAQGIGGTMPASLVLISPAIGVSPIAALATWKRRLALLPGLEGLAWLSIEPEFDPYKYNSFATNAGEQVHRLTRAVARRLAAQSGQQNPAQLPPILVLKSTVDATVSTNAVVDRLLNRLPAARHELVLYDINRSAVTSPLLIDDPGPLTRRLLEATLPFALTLVGSEPPHSDTVIARRRPANSTGFASRRELESAWPRGVISLSHVALPFPADDPLYGRIPPTGEGALYLGQIPLQGERGLLKISTDWLLRLRHNPFYDHLEQRTLDWLDSAITAGQPAVTHATEAQQQ